MVCAEHSMNPIEASRALAPGDTWFRDGTCLTLIRLLIPPFRKYNRVIVPEYQDTTLRAVLPGDNKMLHEMIGVDEDSQGYYNVSGDNSECFFGLFLLTFQTILMYLFPIKLALREVKTRFVTTWGTWIYTSLWDLMRCTQVLRELADVGAKPLSMIF